MSDLTQHLGELMGQTEAERLAAEQAVQAAPAAESSAAASAPDAAAAPAGDAVSALAPAHSAAAMADPVTATPGVDAASTVATHADLEKYAFPFTSHEVFGILPHSIGAKAEGLWHIAQQLFAGNISPLTIAVGGIAVGALAITAVSTAKSWRRGDEYAVEGYGDRMTKVGKRYTVRQDAPASSMRDKRAKPRDMAPAAVAAPEPAPQAKPKPDEGTQASPQPERRRLFGAKPAVSKPDQSQERRSKPQRSMREARRDRNAATAPAPQAPAPMPQPAPVVAAAPPSPAEAAGPKTLRRKLHVRAGTVSYAGTFHGTYGSFQKPDQAFAEDYLKQTNEAFEAAYLKGRGPNLGSLKVGDSHRAERLFMVAARASIDDPQTALTALWQAVEDDSGDAIAWLRLAHFYLEVGQHDQARKILVPLESQSERIGLDIVVAAAANSLGKIAALRGDTDGARKLFAKSLSHAERTENPYMIGVAAANGGLLEASKRKFENARALLARGVRGFDACDERASAARAGLALGIVHAATGDDEAAEQVWSGALEALRITGQDEEAGEVSRWLRGDGVPNAISV